MKEEDGLPVTLVAVHEGVADVKNDDEKIAGNVSVKQSEMTKVFEGSPPEAVETMLPAVESEFLDCAP